jgi:hypothetical protein
VLGLENLRALQVLLIYQSICSMSMGSPPPDGGLFLCQKPPLTQKGGDKRTKKFSKRLFEKLSGANHFTFNLMITKKGKKNETHTK